MSSAKTVDDEQLLRVQRLMREAERELETAVEQGSDEQAKYWLGRKRGIEDTLEACGLPAAR